MKRTELEIVVPVYNEGKRILKLISYFKRKLKMQYRVIICYDDTNDSTYKFLVKNKKKIKEKFILLKNPGLGPNSAIKSGISFSKANVILVYMADDFENGILINKMFNLIRNSKYDLVIPSRFVSGGKFIGGKFLKRLVTRIGSNLLFYLGGVPFKDCTNAFKMFNKKIKSKIKLKSTTGFTFAIEISIKAYFKGYKIYEIASTWRDLTNRKSNFKVLKWIPHYVYWLVYAIKINLKKHVQKLVQER